MRKLLKSWRTAHAFITLENYPMPLHIALGFPRQRDRFQSFPIGQVPRRQTVPVKMPALIGTAPGSNVHSELLFQERLNECPIAVIERQVRQEGMATQFAGCRLVLNPDEGFQRIFVGVQKEQGREKRDADEGLIG